MSSFISMLSCFLFVIGLFKYGHSSSPANSIDCPDFEPKSVDAAQYSGVWFNVMKLDPTKYLKVNCSYINYTLKGPNELEAKVFALSSSEEEKVILNYNLELKNSTNSSETVFEGKNNEGIGKSFSYYCLEVDYNSYSIEFMCDKDSFNGTAFLWILSRDKLISAELQEKLAAVIKRLNLDKDDLYATYDSASCKKPIL